MTVTVTELGLPVEEVCTTVVKTLLTVEVDVATLDDPLVDINAVDGKTIEVNEERDNEKVDEPIPTAEEDGPLTEPSVLLVPVDPDVPAVPEGARFKAI